MTTRRYTRNHTVYVRVPRPRGGTTQIPIRVRRTITTAPR